MAMTTSKTVYRAGHAPLPSGVFVAPFPHRDDEVDACLGAVRLLLLSQTAPAETAAMLIEPVLGEGGYVPAPTAFLEGLVAICREHGILFLADEVQSGFGRTGTMFCVDQHGITPDVVVMAKGLASGFPISAVGASADLMARWPTGSHGGTYGGNPIGCAAAIATIDVLTEPGFLDHVQARGAQLRAGLRALAAEDGGIVDVRGPGLMVASQLADAARVPRVTAHCLTEGHLILMNAGTFGDVIRWMPPLVVSEAEVDTALDAFAKALAATR
jgi:4-aminobutyrate aminotransferase-like enzyme